MYRFVHDLSVYGSNQPNRSQVAQWLLSQCPALFLEQEMLTLLLSTGWFEEQIWDWLKKQNCFHPKWTELNNYKLTRHIYFNMYKSRSYEGQGQL